MDGKLFLKLIVAVTVILHFYFDVMFVSSTNENGGHQGRSTGAFTIYT